MIDTSDLFQLGAVVFGLTEIIKNFMPDKPWRKKITPVIAIVIGGGMNILLNGYTPENLVYGLALGLAATGLYKAAQNTMGA